jgi:hypothetical protein
MLVWKIGNLLTCAFSALDMANSRTLERGPSAPRMRDPEITVPSAKVATTPLPLSLKATSTRFLPYWCRNHAVSFNSFHNSSLRYGGNGGYGNRTRYLDVYSLSAQGAHLAPWDPQPLIIWYARKHIASLAMYNGVITTRIDGDGGVAGDHREPGEDLRWQDLLETVEGPMDGHCPLITPVIELCLFFEDGVANAGLGFGHLNFAFSFQIESLLRDTPA